MVESIIIVFSAPSNENLRLRGAKITAVAGGAGFNGERCGRSHRGQLNGAVLVVDGKVGSERGRRRLDRDSEMVAECTGSTPTVLDVLDVLEQSRGRREGVRLALEQRQLAKTETTTRAVSGECEWRRCSTQWCRGCAQTVAAGCVEG